VVWVARTPTVAARGSGVYIDFGMPHAVREYRLVGALFGPTASPVGGSPITHVNLGVDRHSRLGYSDCPNILSQNIHQYRTAADLRLFSRVIFYSQRNIVVSACCGLT
jgi:hypothetical protein